MTMQQTTKASESVITKSQVTKNSIGPIADALTLTFDPWQNLNATVTDTESQIDSNDTNPFRDHDKHWNNDEVIDHPDVVDGTDDEISDKPDSLEDPVNGIDNDTEDTDNSDEVIDHPDVIDGTDDEISDKPDSLEDPVNSPDDGTANTDNSNGVINYASGITIWSMEPPLESNAPDIIDSETDTDTVDVIDNPDIVDDADNDTQIDGPLTTHSIIWSIFTVADANSIDFGGLNPGDIEISPGWDIDLSADFGESGDSATVDDTQITLVPSGNMTTQEDVFSASNPDAPVFGTLIWNTDFYFTY